MIIFNLLKPVLSLACSVTGWPDQSSCKGNSTFNQDLIQPDEFIFTERVHSGYMHTYIDTNMHTCIDSEKYNVLSRVFIKNSE